MNVLKPLFYKLNILLLAAVCMLFSSCLPNGDQTISFENLIAGGANDDPSDDPSNPSEPGNNDKPSEDEEEKDQAAVVGSDEYKSMERSGFTLIIPRGAVPKTNEKANGHVAFSMSYQENLPDTVIQKLPKGAQIIDKACVKIEPMNFIFNSPLILRSPTQKASNATLLHYNENTGNWDVVPYSCRNDDGTTDAAIIELGYFVLVKPLYADQGLGGVRVKREYLNDDYYYYLTLTPLGGNKENIRRISFASRGKDLYMANVPKGDYSVTISREKRTSWESEPESMDYYTTSNVTVNQSLISSTDGGYENYQGWADIVFNGGKRTDGRTTAWGPVTTPYGTGKFQATLTWINTLDANTDYDLHLYGKEENGKNIHVYYDQKTGGNIALDVDWKEEPGYAIENIYSVSDDLVPGEYTIKVSHFGGKTGTRYNCRVILDGVVVKTVSGAVTTDQGTNDIYTFTLR